MKITIETKAPCYVCSGKGWIRLNHAASATCYACPDGTVPDTYTEDWTSFERVLADRDPFQSGAHSTMPAWYAIRQIDRMAALHGESLPGDTLETF